MTTVDVVKLHDIFEPYYTAPENGSDDPCSVVDAEWDLVCKCQTPGVAKALADVLNHHSDIHHVVAAASAWLTARTALEAADRARSYRDEIEVFECAEKTLADEVRKALTPPPEESK